MVWLSLRILISRRQRFLIKGTKEFSHSDVGCMSKMVWCRENQPYCSLKPNSGPICYISSTLCLGQFSSEPNGPKVLTLFWVSYRCGYWVIPLPSFFPLSSFNVTCCACHGVCVIFPFHIIVRISIMEIFSCVGEWFYCLSSSSNVSPFR